MIFNGQLLCLELLYVLNTIIENIIEINNESIIIYLKKQNYTYLIELCAQFEQKYKLKIDVSKSIEFGLFFGLNQRIILKNGEVIVEGFNNFSDFSFYYYILINWVKKNITLIETVQLSKSCEFKLYTSLWELFNSQIKADVKSGNIKNYLDFQTQFQLPKAVYLSKNPVVFYFGGLPRGELISHHPYPIASINFSKHFEDKSLSSTLIKDLDIASYWHYLVNKLNKTMFYNIKNNEQSNNFVIFNKTFSIFYKQTALNMSLVFLNNKKILYYFNLLAKLGFFYERS
uniref:hypothetical protein n=1 Tax=Ulva meridionalis TaxID=434723 RepID=UPI0028E0A3DC|nr:hypothetical protein NQY40_pgp083 [Ulva meridionalis]WFS80028.1 hypothetical protein [Ulva meridionalis]